MSTATAQPVNTPAIKTRISWVKTLGAIAAVIVFFVVQSLPLEGVSAEGRGVLALVLAAVVMWITQPIPIAFSAFLVIVLSWVLGYVKPEVAFSAFSGTTFWLVFAVLGMASCVSASPLSRRLGLAILSLPGKPTFKRVLLFGFILMVIISFLIPALLAKIAVLLAIMLPMVALFGVPTKSRIGAALAITAVTLGSATNAITPTASAPTAMVYGMLMKAGLSVSWAQWTIIALVPMLLTLLLYFLFVAWYAKPETSEATGGRELIQKQLKAMPRMDAKEIWALVVTLGMLAGWVAGLNPAMVALVGVLLFLIPGIGVMSFSNFISKAIPWELLILVGSLLAIAPILAAVGLTEVFTGFLSVPFSFATNPITFVLAMAMLMIFLLGLNIWLPSLPLLVPILMTIGPAAGVSPVLGAMMLMVMFPQFIFWGIGPQYAMAMKDDVGNMRDWVVHGIAYYVIIVVVWCIWVYLAPAIGLTTG